MPQPTDIVIVGGGPAGLTTALSLQTADPASRRRIVVLEKGTYPREKICAGAVGARADRILERLGAAPDVPSVEISGMSFRGAMGEQSARVGVIGRVVRRFEFDRALADGVRARGIRVLDGVTVEGVEALGAVARVSSSAGPIDARIVVGADGVGSVVRRAMGLGVGALRAQVLELDTEPVASDRPRDLVHFDVSDRTLRGYTWDFPTRVDGRELVCRGIYHLKTGQRGDSGVDVHERLGARLRSIGLDIDRHREKRFAERGLSGGEALVRGPLLLVGEAAGIDPVTGEGIAQAVEYGWLAGRFLARVLCGDASLDRWSRVLRRSRLGVDLRLRRRLVRTLFGPSRAAVERVFVDSPAAVRAGCRHFGGLSPDVLDLARVGASLAGVLGRSLLRRGRRPEREAPPAAFEMT